MALIGLRRKFFLHDVEDCRFGTSLELWAYFSLFEIYLGTAGVLISTPRPVKPQYLRHSIRHLIISYGYLLVRLAHLISTIKRKISPETSKYYSNGFLQG